MGRPSKLNDEVQAKICEAVAKCIPREAAANLAGIDRATFFKWMKRGNPAEPAHNIEKDARYRDFFDAVEKADSAAKAMLIGIIVDAAPKDWKAAMTLAERKWPKEFARRIYKPDDNTESVSVTFTRPAMDDRVKSDDIVPPPPLVAGNGNGKNGNGKGRKK